jgi:hypothetical protein
MMMKRVRALDGRQFRRPKKSKFGENVYFNTSTFVYLKLISIWVSCIAFDLLVGCRLELGWPIVLFVRHFNEIMNAPNGPLRFYSTFSIFYLLLTLTSDLICYLFLPVQLLLFFASIHVWLQFAYQTIDRGLSPTVLLFWGVFLFFEYFFRYKMTSPQWYQSRSVMVATSLFPAMTDAFLANQMSTTRLTLYRLFASHALGFPLVTLSFRLKTIISNWLYERCRNEVQKKNEVFDRILTEALPSIYEGKKRHELNSRPQQLAIEGDALDFELDPTGSDLLDEPRLCLSSNGPVPSIFDKLNTAPTNSPSSQSSRSAGVDGIPFNRKTSKIKIPMSYKNQNGNNSSNQLNGKGIKISSSKSSRNGRINTDIMDDITGDGNNLIDNEYSSIKSRKKSKSSSSYFVISLITKLISAIQQFFVNWLLSIISLLSTIGDIIFKILNIKPLIAANSHNNMSNEIGKDQQQQDDMISTSGDGSQRADEDSDGESISTSILDLPSTNISNTKGTNGIVFGKKKGKQQQQKVQISRARTPTLFDGEFEVPIVSNGTSNSTTISTSNVTSTNMVKNNKKGKQQIEEKREDEIDRLKIDLRGAKLVENELREQITALCQIEKSCKNEVQQYKIRYDQLDAKYKNLTKQQEQNKIIMANMEKRKEQLEKELANEKCSGIKNEKTFDEKMIADGIMESLKTKIGKLENELRKIRAEVKNKEDYAVKLEAKLKEVNNQKSQAQKFADDGSQTVNRLQHENITLKKALSEENRIKQDLFKALKTSKAQIDLLKARLNVSDDNEILAPVGNNSSSSAINNNGDIFRDSPITAPPSPPPQSANLDHLISMTQTYCMPYPFSSQYNGIRSSPSEMRDSPTQHTLSLDPSLHQSMTSATTRTS